MQVAEQDVEPAQRAGALGDQVVAAVAEQPQRHRVVGGGDLVAERRCASATAATEAASVRSVLWALPAPSSRARAASLAGTSTTSSPPPTSCWATVCPSPVAPSTAHRRAGHGTAQASNWTTARSVMATRSCRAAGCGRRARRRQGPLVRVDADGDHRRPFSSGEVVRDRQPAFRSTHPTVEPPRGGCRPRSAGCQRANPTGGKSTTSQSTGTLDATGPRPPRPNHDSTSQSTTRWVRCGGIQAATWPGGPVAPGS